MTLASLLTQPVPDIATLRTLWLAFPTSLADALEAAQADQTTHRVAPIELTDGRLAVCCDLLSEIQPGGIFAVPFSRLDSNNFELVEVLDDAEFRALLPEPEDE